MPADFVLFCKSYARDLRRTLRMVESAQRCNRDRLPLVLAVPGADEALFRAALPAGAVELVSDEAIVAAHPLARERGLLARLRATPGRIAQQVVKSEAWRLLGCDAYLCTDADTVFLRPFGRADFLAPTGHPYTLLHQSREYLQLAVDRGRERVLEHWLAESERVRALLGRDAGPHYDFGPQPLLWSARVWNDLHERWLAPRGWTLWDAIDTAPTEIRWYGEALLAFGSIPIAPIEPLCRVYHYDWHYFALRRLGETEARLAAQYIGVVYQSNWQYEADHGAPTKGPLSRLARTLRRQLNRWR
jgi:hypothetical protein